MLESHYLLDDNGRVAPGPTAPQGIAINTAICDYVFGTPDEVAATAKLVGTVTLHRRSGYMYNGGSNGNTLLCAYNVGSRPAEFVLLIQDHKIAGSDGNSLTTTDLPGGFAGGYGYAPDYRGKTIAAQDGKQWLREAGGRVSRGSV